MAATTTAGAFDSEEQARSAIEDGKAKNVILLIGDGMGDSEMTLARDYTVGADGRLNLDKFPLTGAYTTYAVHADGTPDYVTDSAASGTGWATGHKTVNGRISKTPGTDKAVPTVLELAQKNGYATGSVTTSELTDATPAVLASHATDRSCQGPADMAKCPADTIAAGGPGSIAEQSVNHKVDVLLGGGKARFDQKVTDGAFKGMTVTEQAQKLGYQVVTDDHGHTSQIVPLEATPPGLSSTLVTDEGQQLKVNYSTNTPGQSQEHTGTQVRIAAQGPEAYRVLGVTNQTDLFTTVREALRLR
ncbi:alkaline phosphatase [Streptomyces sp. NPDC059455]|uniref:alkaline phosphatase n=1 Tax=Streptomyces sp. NPDC059455 TaxID=3346837 RepID=UPI0036781C9B